MCVLFVVVVLLLLFVFFLGGGCFFLCFFSSVGGYFLFLGVGMGYPVFISNWGGGVFTFFKLTGSGGHHNCFVGDGGVCKNVPPALPL